MAVPNATTRFELAWLILWIVLTIALLGLIILRRIHMPAQWSNLVKGYDQRKLSMIVGGLQLCVFVLLLAALANDVWSKYDYDVSTGIGITGVTSSVNVWVHYGLTNARTRFDSSGTYDCGDVDSDLKTYCRTYKTAGAFTLIFGLVGIFASFFLLVVVALTLVGKELAMVVRYAHPLVPLVALVQFVCLQAMVLIWGVSGHDLLRQANSDVSIGSSWALAFVSCVVSIATAVFYAQGPGVPARGEPAYAAGPEMAAKGPVPQQAPAAVV